jgi:hypothetical protein
VSWGALLYQLGRPHYPSHTFTSPGSIDNQNIGICRNIQAKQHDRGHEEDSNVNNKYKTNKLCAISLQKNYSSEKYAIQSVSALFSHHFLPPAVPVKASGTYPFPRYPGPMPRPIHNCTGQAGRPHRIGASRIRSSLRGNRPRLIQRTLNVSRSKCQLICGRVSQWRAC